MKFKFPNYFALLLLALLSLNAASAWAVDVSSAPTSIANAYSDLDMRARLAVKANAQDCQGEQCIINEAFDQKVQRLGGLLAATAYTVYPDLGKKVADFKFSVVNKKSAGMASNAAGKIVVFRGVQNLDLSDDALSFVLAREMGHVIGGHHHKNISTKVLFSVMASILFPAATLFSASHVAAEATTTVVTSVASTVTSFVGSEVAISKIKPNQLADADQIAVTLLEAQGWDGTPVVTALQLQDFKINGWVKDLQVSVNKLNPPIDYGSLEDGKSDQAKADGVKQVIGVFPAQSSLGQVSPANSPP